jgi:hypothetical protein
MSSFYTFFELGYDHILDLNGFDHILFVIVLCTPYSIHEWKQVLILVTAFTIGHSLTLALSILDIVLVNSTLIEFLIPLTILITAISNIFKVQTSPSKNKLRASYFLALLFGLIHGLGFSNYLKVLLGRNNEIIGQLFGFNIGLEVGQILIVASFLIISFIITDLMRISKRDFKLIVSSSIIGISLMLILDSDYWQL